MMKKRAFLLLEFILFALLLLALGCNKDDDNSSSPTQPQNHAPAIQVVTASPSLVSQATDGVCYPDESQSTLTCIATDADGDSLDYYWSCPQGCFMDGINIGPSVTWCAPFHPDSCMIYVIVSDGIATDDDSTSVIVQ
jgi:hypothetical protein